MMQFLTRERERERERDFLKDPCQTTKRIHSHAKEESKLFKILLEILLFF